MPRQPKGRVTISQRKDGWFYAAPTVGVYPSGRTKTKPIRRRTAELVKQALDELAEATKAGVGVPTKIETVTHWLDHWLENIIRSGTNPRSYNTWRDYESICRLYLKPGIGGQKLRGTRRRLEPEHVEAMFAQLPAKLSDSYKLRIFRVLDASLKLAVKKGKADYNVCDRIETPTSRPPAMPSMSLGEAMKVVTAAAADPDGDRYLVSILLGPRQGEVLGLRWPVVELDPSPPDEPHLKVVSQVQRRTWQHGCADPVSCVTEHATCRTKKCPPRYRHGCPESDPCGKRLDHFCPARRVVKGACSFHKRQDGSAKPCPPLCKPKCTGHARRCPSRVGGGLVETETKAHRKDATIPLGELLTAVFRRQRVAQQQVYAEADRQWDAKGYVFQGAMLGKPRDPRRDYAGWQRIRAAAGLDSAGLHIARHTAASMMTAVGTDIRVIQTVLGHAKITTTELYAAVGMAIKKEAVDKVAAALFDGQLMALLGSPTVAQNVVSNGFQTRPTQQLDSA